MLLFILASLNIFIINLNFLIIFVLNSLVEILTGDNPGKFFQSCDYSIQLAADESKTNIINYTIPLF